MRKFIEENIKTKMRCPVCSKYLYLQINPKKITWNWILSFYLVHEYRFVCVNCRAVDVRADTLSQLVLKLTSEELISEDVEKNDENDFTRI